IRWMACARQTRYWTGPAFGGCTSNSSKHTTNSENFIPLDTQFLLVEWGEKKKKDSTIEPQMYALVLPLVDGSFRTSLQSERDAVGSKAKDSDTLVCHIDSFDDTVHFSSLATDPLQLRSVYILVGSNPYDMLKQGFRDVADELQTFNTLDRKQVSGMVNQFGWCSWDAFYSDVTPEGVIEGVKSLCEAGTPPRTVIIDDGWQDLENYFETETDFCRQLKAFTPNEKFQKFGLKNLVTKLKRDFGVRQVLCWHALHGYWRGISPALASSLTRQQSVAQNHLPNHSEHLLRLDPIISWDSVSLFGVGILMTPRDVKQFYDGIHSPLVEAGVDGVKIDVQSGLASVGGGVGGGPYLAKIYTEAMEDSVQSRFTSSDKAINCINCMSHSTENLYRYKHTSIVRASDDFYPNRPTSHTVHLVNVAYNSLFLREICLPDWDMFQSANPSAALHAAARAIGGCPVYVSDKPGQHDTALLRQLVLPDGSVLRASKSGVPTRDCLFQNVGRDGTTALKIWNWNAFKNNCDLPNNGSGVVGAFNVQGATWNFDRHENDVSESPQPVEAVIRPTDVDIF
ncbi:glycosyl hydrolase, partial [Thalassiosira pseudonana CCMP1335]